MNIASPTVVALEVDSAWVVVLVVSLTTLLAAVFLRRLIARPGGFGSGLLLCLPLLLPVLAALIYQGAVLPEVTVLMPISALVDERSGNLMHLLFLSDGDGKSALYAIYGSAGTWIFFLGLAISAFMLVRRLCGALVMRRVMARCSRPEPGRDAHLMSVVEQLAGRAGLKRTPAIAILPEGVSGAFAVGAGRGKILISRDLIDALDEDELPAVLAHEIAHLEARDVAVVFAAGFLRDLTAWNPLAHLAFRRLATDRELEADKRAATMTGAPLALASGLLKVCELMRGRSDFLTRGALALWRPRGNVSRRISTLLALADSGRHLDLPLLRGTHLAAALLVALLGLQAGAQLAASNSTWAFVWGNTSTEGVSEWEPPAASQISRDDLSKKQRREQRKGARLENFLRSSDVRGTVRVAEANADALSTKVYSMAKRRGIPVSEMQLRGRPISLLERAPFGVYRIGARTLPPNHPR